MKPLTNIYALGYNTINYCEKILEMLINCFESKLPIELNKILIKNVKKVYYSSSFLSDALELFLNYSGERTSFLKAIYKVFSNINTLNN